MRKLSGLCLFAVASLASAEAFARSGPNQDDAALQLLQAMTSLDHLFLIGSAAGIAFAASVLLAFAVRP